MNGRCMFNELLSHWANNNSLSYYQKKSYYYLPKLDYISEKFNCNST